VPDTVVVVVVVVATPARDEDGLGEVLQVYLDEVHVALDVQFHSITHSLTNSLIMPITEVDGDYFSIH